MSQKAERPTLQGQRFRTRKRDEKEKFNPSGFRDTILHSFDALNGGLCLKSSSNSDNLEQQTNNLNNIANTNSFVNTTSTTAPSVTATPQNNNNNINNNTNSDSTALGNNLEQNNQAAENQDFSSSTNSAAQIADANNQQQQPDYQLQEQQQQNHHQLEEKNTTNTNNSPCREGYTNKNNNEHTTSIKRQLDIDAVIKCLLTDTKIDYRVYGEQLFDIIIAGGILAPGGSILVDSDSSKQYRTDICLFKAVDANDLPTIKNFANIFVRLIQRFGYLEKTLEEEFKKIIVFLKGFDPDDRVKLAKITAVLISLGILAPHVLLSGIQDHLVKDGYALDFLVQVLQTWIVEKDPNTVWNSMRRAGVDNKLLDFLPPNKRSSDTIIQTFQSNGLDLLVSFQRTKESEAKKSELQKKIAAQIKNKASSKDIVELVKESTSKNNLDESEVVVLIWKTLMSIVEWNKKEELVAEQAMRHLRTYAPLMEAFTKSAKAQLALIIRIQEFCYENMNFLKVFHKIIVLLYKADVLTEDIIIEWYKRGHSNKGKSVFLEQTKPFIEWLTSAEEESDGE